MASSGNSFWESVTGTLVQVNENPLPEGGVKHEIRYFSFTLDNPDFEVLALHLTTWYHIILLCMKNVCNYSNQSTSKSCKSFHKA